MGADAFHEAVWQVCPLAVMAVDEDLIVRTMSLAAEKLLDIEADKIIGRHIKDCALLGQAGLANLIQTLRDGVEHSITCYLCGAGEVKTEVKLQTRRLTDKGHNHLGVAIIMELSGLQIDTDKAINEVKLDLIRHMSIGIAHHMRNSLTAVRGFIQIMQGKGSGEPVKGISEFSSIALKELDRANDVIGNILHLAESSELKKESVNVENLLENVISFIRGKAALAGILVVREIVPDLPGPCVDVVKIINALFNILDNAIRAMPSGGRLLLRAFLVPAENSICIQISDTGVGIPPENIKYIFNPFFTTWEEGAGFGLSLANKIVLDHNGQIKVTSEEGTGSTFSVYLPL